VILLKIDPHSVVAIEFKGDAPRTTDVHRVASRFEALKGVKVKTRQVQLLGSGCHIKTIKPDKNALVNFCVNLRRPAGRPEVVPRAIVEIIGQVRASTITPAIVPVANHLHALQEKPRYLSLGSDALEICAAFTA